MPRPRRYADGAERQAAYRRRQSAVATQPRSCGGVPLRPVPEGAGHARWKALTRNAHLLLQTAQAEMQEYLEQRSESWQDSERGAVLLERLQAIEEAQTTLEDLLN